MSVYTRTTKSNGTTEWENGEVVTHTEHNDEWNAFVLKFNGEIDDANVKTAADIGPTKIGDYAVNDAEFLGTGSDPGDHFNTNLPSTLPKELEALRHRIKWNGGGGTNLQALQSGGGMVTVGWTEPPTIGRQLLINPGFEIQTGAAGTAPDGWSLINTPATAIIRAASGSEDEAGVNKRSFHIVGSGAGITQTVSGLKESTKYRVGAAWVRVAGTIVLGTTGGLGSVTEYGDVVIADTSSSSFSYYNGVIKTDSNGADIVVNITAATASAELYLFYAWFYEMADDAPLESPSLPIQVVRDSAAVVYTGLDSNAWDDTNVHTPLSLSVYVPGVGYALSYQADLNIGHASSSSPSSDTQEISITLEMQIDAGGWNAVDVRTMKAIQDDLSYTGHPHLRHLIPDPTPGSNYQFRIVIGLYDKESALMNSLIHSRQPDSRAELELRRY
ncbi:MAG: hypothetical protein E2O85_01545 [Bacteroidetes bacterium]|nr:MAG: hypothetical protein E2O85_01545 [Bacteroidota bacterium]